MIQFTVSVMNEAVSLLWNSKQKPGQGGIQKQCTEIQTGMGQMVRAYLYHKYENLEYNNNCQALVQVQVRAPVPTGPQVE